MSAEGTTTKQPLLRIRFEGSAIHGGRILYDDLSTFMSNVNLAITRILNSMQMGTSVKRGRPSKETQLLSSLEIVSVRKGSFTLTLDLRRDEQQFPGWDMGEQSVDVFMRGLNAMQNGRGLPQEFDSGVMMALRDAGRVIERGIDKISLNSNSTVGSQKAVYNSLVREHVIARLNRLERGYAVVEGRLLMLDVAEGKDVCKVWPSTGDPVLCKFDEEITEQVWRNVRRFVRVKGEATSDSLGKIVSLRVKDIESIDESSSMGNTLSPTPPFWTGKAFDELAMAQGVYPIDDVTSLTGNWPADEDFDSFIAAVRSAGG